MKDIYLQIQIQTKTICLCICFLFIGQGVSPKEQLAYLSQVLGFTVTYNDFPKKGEYLSLVSLSTNPPQVKFGKFFSICETMKIFLWITSAPNISKICHLNIKTVSISICTPVANKKRERLKNFQFIF